MSEGMVRKVQPFTIGTRLSVPAGPKCPDFAQGVYLQSASLDNCALQHNLNSLYLQGRTQQVCGREPCLVSAVVKQVAPPKREQQEHMAAEDQLNQNVVSSSSSPSSSSSSSSSSSVSRSIKKITISGRERSGSTGPEKVTPTKGAKPQNNNNNNNNNVTNTSDPHLPRIVGVSCENKPKSQFKVLLKKDCSDDGHTRVKLNGEKSTQQTSAPDSQRKEPQRKENHPHAQSEASASAATSSSSSSSPSSSSSSSSISDCFTQRTSLFNREVLQAEAWIKGKLQDLKDGCNIQRCPLQDWEEASQTLQRDLKDFENTFIQLNQMGEQLICKLNPTSDLVKKQLSQLRDQWQSLKRTAANQTRALGGAKNLQEFNKKVDKLEAWIKDKEEEQSLVNVLGDSVDKMQLTRRILDLKQDEQLHRNLHEEINHLALKLEKQGKTDGKNISTRRKHINKMWLKVQSHLKNCHENLQLALEVSSFYQQADNTLLAINNMSKTISESPEWDVCGDREIRDIAAQIMMLDVSVSQLSNLHPALAAGVTQKQSEVKEQWALLHKLVRSDRAALSLPGSAFTREDGDPVTPACEPLGLMGTDAQRIMGKEVKEEQNRLKGCVTSAECESGSSRAASSQRQEQPSASHTPPPLGDDNPSSEVIVRHQPQAESRKPSAEPGSGLSAAPPGHPQLHMQLQKFTVSADKTLSWLKDNVSTATQVCSIAALKGLEAAGKCQRSLERDILTNRARIEVVKREGRGLVRAQHPGSARIEEFLGQLEVLWEELRRRHQRNAVFLQASEELGFRVVKVLQALGSLEAWLEWVELSMKESALAVDPETVSAAERQSCLLEQEVAARSPELGALRQEVDGLHAHSHPLTQRLPARMDEVERKYHRVQSALTQQSSELQDTRMLTEFLERVELEESQDGRRYNLSQPLHSEIPSAPSLLGLQSSEGPGAEPLMESMGDPVEELREAVEMLNDTVRERGRSQSHDQAVQELLSKHARLAAHVEECARCAKELGLEVLERETDLAIRCQPDRCGLEALQEQQDHLEIDYEVIREEVRQTQSLASRLDELCPERMRALAAKMEATLQAWAQLGASATENRSRLREFVLLRDFFRSYLAMISWTEDTRTCIFSHSALHPGKDGQRPLAAELDMQIERKFEEFDELAAKGRGLLDKEHHLTQMVRERLEELRSMLGWILLHWRAQKQQRLHKRSRREPAQDNIYSEATMCSTITEFPNQSSVPESDVYVTPCQSPLGTTEEDKSEVSGDSPPVSSVLLRQAELQDEGQTDDWYEVMNRIPESPKPSIVVLKEPGSPTLGGTVNLILSFGNTGDSQVLVVEPPAGTEEVVESEPLHRVSTYLHVKDNLLAAAPVYESITLPRQKSRSAASTSPIDYPPPSSSSSPTFHPSTSGGGGTFIFSSLKRKSKKRKRKRDARRHTIQRIMGVEAQTEEEEEGEEGEEGEEEPPHGSEAVAYDTRTWPLKDGRRKKSSAAGGAEPPDYMKNPMLRDIDAECAGEYSIIPYAVSEEPNPGQVRGHCRFLSLGSVLSFDLPKDVTLIPSIQDIITIAPPESKKGAGSDPDPLSQRRSTLSSFRRTRASPADACSSEPPADEVKISRSPPLPRKEGEHPAAEPDQGGTGSDSPIYVNQPLSSCAHKCPSVHTLVRNLKGHKYHKCARPHSLHEGAPGPQGLSQASRMVVNLKSSVSVRQDSVGSTSSGIKVCADAPDPDVLRSKKAVVGRLVSLQVGGKTREDSGTSPPAPRPDSAGRPTEPVHPDHLQFEEEEEELEDIWNLTSNYRQSVCSDIMYQPSQEDSAPSDRAAAPQTRSPSPQTPNVLYRNLVTASAPNLLVAEFKLPSHVQSMLGYDKEQGVARGRLPPLAAGDRKSWAAFPNREPTSKSSAVTVNETAADPVKLPDMGDNQRYIYQYREDEEEEEEEEEVVEAKVREEAEHTGGSQDQSMSLLSAHMGLDGACQQRQSTQSLEEESAATGGRCFTLSGNPELQSMEGTLERKHKLQLGGKKAASRGWNSYHAVLHRHTLCFYQDRKEILRSSVCGLPMNLLGAECSPALEYSKKPNCLRLRLRDGSEYLLNAPSRFMMKKWMMKIQANTGQRESCVPVDPGLHISPSLCSCSCNRLAACHCSSRHDVTSTFPRRKPPARGAAQTKEIVVLTREFSHMPQSHWRSLDERSSSHGGCDDDDDDDRRVKHMMTHRLSAASNDITGPSPPSSPSQEWLSDNNKRRSHSFTSATYQHIKPLLPPPGGLDRGPNYCVTLVVGDKKAADLGGSGPAPVPVLAAAGWQRDVRQDSAVRSYASLPRPRNKSVFKKFFGRRDV